MSNKNLEQIKIDITGRVQAVFYRGMLVKVAESLGLLGYIENKDDGGVEIVAQGGRDKLEEFLRWCQKGNALTKLDGMTYKFGEVEKELPPFHPKIKKGFINDRLNAVKTLGQRVRSKFTGEIEEMKVPQHVVIIPDGNRRWARSKGWKPWAGHKKASQSGHLLSLVKEARKMGVKYVTFWAMSTENWKRDKEEVEMLFKILQKGMQEFGEAAREEGIRFMHIGRKDRIPAEILAEIEKLEEDTKGHTEMSIQIALDYGGRDEIVRAVNKIYEQKDLTEITADTIRAHIDSVKEVPDPDLIIRTSGEKRYSGALLWQSDYAEFYFSDVFFPEFTAEHIRLAILDYSYRVRRFGGTAAKDVTDAELKVPTDDELSEDYAVSR